MKKYFNKNNINFFISLVLLFSLQAIIYILIKYIEGPPHLIYSSFDVSFPFVKDFIWIYDSWYPFLFIVLIALYNKDATSYKRFYISVIISLLITYSIFLVYPTTVMRPELQVNDLTSYVLSLTYKYDEPLNCLPSIHCIFCYTSMFAILSSKKVAPIYKIGTTLYLILIIFSTMFVKQHVLYDVIVALIISLIGRFLTYIPYFKKHIKDKNI